MKECMDGEGGKDRKKRMEQPGGCMGMSQARVGRRLCCLDMIRENVQQMMYTYTQENWWAALEVVEDNSTVSF